MNTQKIADRNRKISEYIGELCSQGDRLQSDEQLNQMLRDLAAAQERLLNAAERVADGVRRIAG